MTILRRSVASTNAIQKVFTNQQTCHYLDHFEAHLMRFRPVSISKYLACYLATHSCH